MEDLEHSAVEKVMVHGKVRRSQFWTSGGIFPKSGPSSAQSSKEETGSVRGPKLDPWKAGL